LNPVFIETPKLTEAFGLEFMGVFPDPLENPDPLEKILPPPKEEGPAMYGLELVPPKGLTPAD